MARLRGFMTANQSDGGPPRSTSLLRARLLLGSIGLLLLVLGSAHVCTDRQPYPSLNDDGDYWGWAATGADDSYSTDNVVSARTEGVESCNFILQTDWAALSINIGTDFTLPAIAGGLGGYNTDFGDCFLEHRVGWHAIYAWSGIHGQSDTGLDIDCWDLNGGAIGLPCPP